MTAAPVGLICGGGALPVEAAEAIERDGRPLFLVGLRGSAPAEIERFPHGWVRIGEIGKLFKLLEGAGVRELAIVGAVQRPALKDLGFDLTGLASVPEIRRLMAGGDDQLLRGVVGFLEGKGYAVRGVHEVAPGLTAQAGLLGAHEGTAEDAAGVAAGVAALGALGPFDVGQAAVAIGRRIVAIEAAEGTDMMLRRVARIAEKGRIRRDGRGGVLVKLPKPGQDLRVDLPAIGPRTIALAEAAGLSGVAIAEGHVLIASRAETIALADAAGLFVAGVPA